MVSSSKRFGIRQSVCPAKPLPALSVVKNELVIVPTMIFVVPKEGPDQV